MWETIERLLKERGMNKNKLATLAGINKNSLIDLKMGRKKSLKFEDVVKIADALDISLEEFRKGWGVLQFILYGLRKKAGLSQADMAKKLEISEASYRRKELERSEFKLTEMFKIADILDKDISDIFTKTTSRKVNKNQPN